MELSELIQQIQAEMERGDYKAAARLGEHAVEHAPSCFTAHRLLGEIRLELHDVDGAIEHFQIALNYDPMSVVVRLGMGAAAEDRQDAEAAYACYLHSWEINPGLDQVRDRLVHLRRTLGVDPRLHLTRAGLASVHLRAGRFDRAITELRSLVEAEPQGRRARCALVEALWRNGDDAAAAAVCQGGLDEAPENGRYLVVLAEIELRLHAPSASGTLARLHAIDPFGEMAALMAEWLPDRDVSALFAGPVIIPQFVIASVEPPVASATRHAGPALGPAPVMAISVEVPPAPMLTAPVPVVAGLDASIQPFVWDEAPPALAVPAPSGWDDWRSPAPVEPRPPVIPAEAASGEMPSSRAHIPAPFETADGGIDLTAGWDELDQALVDATPPAVADDRFADLMTELSVEGLAPFQAVEPGVDESAWEPLFASPETAGEFVAATISGAPQIAKSTLVPVDEPTPAKTLFVASDAVRALEPIPSAPIADPAEEPIASDHIARGDPAGAGVDEFANLTPFSFEESALGLLDVDEPYDFSDVDAVTARRELSPAQSLPVAALAPLVAASSAGAPLTHRQPFPDMDVMFGAGPVAPALNAPAPIAPAPVAPVEPARPPEPTVSIYQVLRASKHRPRTRPSAPVRIVPDAAVSDPVAQDVMFHVEHHRAADVEPAAPFSIGRDALLNLRIRLIEEENSAGEVARTLESTLSDGRLDPFVARVLGEAYLRLGKPDQAAAQFRQAMLARGRSAGSMAR